MTCRSCGAEIADKAIVCYRCGTSTAETATPAVSRPRRPNWTGGAVMVVIILLGAWLIPKTTPGSPERIGAWVVTWIVVLTAAAAIRRRSGR